MQFLLFVVVGIAAYAGYKGWPLYTVLPVAGALVVWNLMYFGTRAVQLATGGGPSLPFPNINHKHHSSDCVFWGRNRTKLPNWVRMLAHRPQQTAWSELGVPQRVHSACSSSN